MERIQIALCYVAACVAGVLLPADQLRELTAAAGTLTLTLRGACLVTLLPLGLAAWAYWAFGRVGAFAVTVLRGLLLGAALGASSATLGAFLLFGGLLGGAVMVWYLQRRLELGRRDMVRDMALCAGLCLAIAVVDAYWVAPFLRAALNTL